MTDSLTIFLQLPYFLVSLVFVIGLMIGSFLNVVIYRLPIILHRNWRSECTDYLQIDASNTLQLEPFNLALPLSHCPNCHVPIKFYHNIPVISYFLLKGRCSACQSKISLRYPVIELFTGLTSAIVAWHFGYTLETVFALILTWSLISLSFIDIDHQLLPDNITLPILWLGIALSLFGYFTDTHASIIGTIAGYLSLWSLYHLFKILTKKEGMGYGDFKLLALLGAWLGWHYLPLIILLSSLVGTIIGLLMISLNKQDRNAPIPFGPYLAVSGWLALIWGNDLNTFYFNSAGF